MLQGHPQKNRAYLAGIVDAEGCFSISIKKQSDTRFGWVIDPVFTLSQHKDNHQVLAMLKGVLGCGRIVRKPGQPELLLYVVDNRRQLREKLIPFFRRNRLLIKASDFQNFAEIVEGLERKQHWTKEGFLRLVEKALLFEHTKGHRKYALKEIKDTIR